MATRLNQVLISLQKVVRLFEAADLRYSFTGGILVNVYGLPRTTEDLDIVADPAINQAQINQLIRLARPDFFFDPLSVQEGYDKYKFYQLIDNETYIKVAVHLSQLVQGELDRVHRVSIQGFSIPALSLEDAILSKLIWIKKGSTRGRRDVVHMLTQSKADMNILRTQAERLDVTEILEELLAMKQTDMF